MRCLNCGRVWPDEYRVCPLCAVTLSAEIGEDASGAIAQGQESAAASTGGLAVAGSVYGSILQVYQTPPGKPSLSDKDVRFVLGEYLNWVRNAYSKTRLYGLESLPTAQGHPVRELKDVFVPITLCRFFPPQQSELETMASQAGERTSLARAWVEWTERQRGVGDRISPWELLTFSDRIAIVGGAGSGKSTLLAYLAVILAEAAQQEGDPPLPLPDSTQLPVPLIIPLRYYRDYLDLCQRSPRERLTKPRTGTLPGFIPWYLKRRSPALELSDDFFDRLLLGGGCLLMLDGLDEVVSRDERGRVRQEVENLVQDVYPGNHVIVTAREAGYRNEAVFGDDFARLDVQALDEDQIQTLIMNWCRQLYPGEEETRARQLIADVREINARRVRWDLPPLVSTPLMTTMVVSVKWGETELPRERAKLYEAGTKVILQAQYIPEDPARKELIEWGGLWEAQRDWLSILALEMHEGGQAGAAIREPRLREILAPHLEEDALDRFVQSVRHRGGLLEERGEFFQFIHLTFQEFLAARLLAKQRKEGWPRLRSHVADPWWREVILLTYGFSQVDYAPAAQALLDWLCQLTDGEERLAGLELAGAALLELEEPDVESRRQLAQQISSALTDPVMREFNVLRAQAGDTLARLGDPRFHKDALGLLAEPSLGLVEIPAGAFLMGTREEDISWLLQRFGGELSWYTSETPQRQVTLPTYYISKYPVTVAQFRRFVEESGYEPEDPDAIRGPGNRPVVWVVWREAVRYCEWLAEKLLAYERTPEPIASLLRDEGWVLTLPSEAEWEKAARGTDGRIFSWGSVPDPSCANYSKTRVGGTSSVGCFPDGASPYGIQDMCGNAWEWCRTKWERDYSEYLGDHELEGESPRVVRGGSFDLGAAGIRCAFRYGGNPTHSYSNRTFRVVISSVRR